MTTPEQREQLRAEELCNRWAAVGCEVAERVRNCPATLPVRVRELTRLVEVASDQLHRLRQQLPQDEKDHADTPPVSEKLAVGQM